MLKAYFTEGQKPKAISRSLKVAVQQVYYIVNQFKETLQKQDTKQPKPKKLLVHQ